MIMISPLSRYEGCMIGLAAGDALGTTVEFRKPGTFVPMTDIVGGGVFGLKKGEWTDDTSMALCLAESLVLCKGSDAHDQMQRYLRWYHEGYLSSNGRCFDIGSTVRQALDAYSSAGDPFVGSVHCESAGNGSLMRLAPVPLFFAANARKAIEMSGESSRTTHGARACVDACRYFGALIVGAVNGASKDELLSRRFTPLKDMWTQDTLCEEIDDIACSSFTRKNPPSIVGSGYVVRSLEAALWAFHSSSSFREGCLLAVNLGDDADTTGAIYGQLAGAYYGVENIPHEWHTCLAHTDLIHSMAGKLFAAATAYGTE
jgi:ADP-ribosylglycohydrolase